MCRHVLLGRTDAWLPEDAEISRLVAEFAADEEAFAKVCSRVEAVPMIWWLRRRTVFPGNASGHRTSVVLPPHQFCCSHAAPYNPYVLIGAIYMRRTCKGKPRSCCWHLATRLHGIVCTAVQFRSLQCARSGRCKHGALPCLYSSASAVGAGRACRAHVLSLLQCGMHALLASSSTAIKGGSMRRSKRALAHLGTAAPRQQAAAAGAGHCCNVVRRC